MGAARKHNQEHSPIRNCGFSRGRALLVLAPDYVKEPRSNGSRSAMGLPRIS